MIAVLVRRSDFVSLDLLVLMQHMYIAGQYVGFGYPDLKRHTYLRLDLRAKQNQAPNARLLVAIVLSEYGVYLFFVF